jgi:hypothetical protein
MHFDFPVFAKPGRGLPFTYVLSFDSSVWSPVTVNGAKSWQPAPNWNWRAITEAATGYLSRDRATVRCQIPDSFPPRFFNTAVFSNFKYHDAFGVIHFRLYEYCRGLSGRNRSVGHSVYRFFRIDSSHQRRRGRSPPVTVPP